MGIISHLEEQIENLSSGTLLVTQWARKLTGNPCKNTKPTCSSTKASDPAAYFYHHISVI